MARLVIFSKVSPASTSYSYSYNTVVLSCTDIYSTTYRIHDAPASKTGFNSDKTEILQHNYIRRLVMNKNLYCVAHKSGSQPSTVNDGGVVIAEQKRGFLTRKIWLNSLKARAAPASCFSHPAVAGRL